MEHFVHGGASSSFTFDFFATVRANAVNIAVLRILFHSLYKKIRQNIDLEADKVTGWTSSWMLFRYFLEIIHYLTTQLTMLSKF